MRLLVATKNPGKILEYREIMKGLPFEDEELIQMVLDKLRGGGSFWKARRAVRTRNHARFSFREAD